MAKLPKSQSPDEPLRHPDHPRPVTRRDFMRQGFVGASAVVTGSLLDLLLAPQTARAATEVFPNLDSDIVTIAQNAGCPIGAKGHNKIPFICFDLAGGANIAGSNVVVGGPGGQFDPLSTAGYGKLGISSSDLPSAGTNVDTTLGLAFHTRSAMLAGIKATLGGAAGGVNGFVIPAISLTDTNVNPHNPMYGIAQAGIDPSNNNPGYGAKGSLVTLIGTVASVSGGNSESPAGLIIPSIQPTKISQPSDDTTLISTGNMTNILSAQDAVTVMEATARISSAAIDKYSFTNNPGLKDILTCAYTKAADTTNQFATGPDALNPNNDSDITSIFSSLGGISASSAYSKTASVMELVVNGYAGAGTITLPGYDYHTGNRSTGEQRDILAGQCIGACLAYAAAKGKPLMIYVISDGSLFSNGTPDSGTATVNGTSVDFTGKGVWTGDSATTACTFALVYNPGGAPTLTATRNGNNQLGAFQTSGSVQAGLRTANGNPIIAANNVTGLVYTLLLNYMALHGQQGSFQACFPNANLGGFGASLLDDLTMFNPIVNGTLT